MVSFLSFFLRHVLAVPGFFFKPFRAGAMIFSRICINPNLSIWVAKESLWSRGRCLSPCFR